jgi:hypothetical protein
MPVPEAGLTAEKADPASSTRTPESKKPSRMNWAKCLILLGWPTGLCDKQNHSEAEAKKNSL